MKKNIETKYYTVSKDFKEKDGFYYHILNEGADCENVKLFTHSITNMSNKYEMQFPYYSTYNGSGKPNYNALWNSIRLLSLLDKIDCFGDDFANTYGEDINKSICESINSLVYQLIPKYTKYLMDNIDTRSSLNIKQLNDVLENVDSQIIVRLNIVEICDGESFDYTIKPYLILPLLPDYKKHVVITNNGRGNILIDTIDDIYINEPRANTNNEKNKLKVKVTKKKQNTSLQQKYIMNYTQFPNYNFQRIDGNLNNLLSNALIPKRDDIQFGILDRNKTNTNNIVATETFGLNIQYFIPLANVDIKIEDEVDEFIDNLYHVIADYPMLYYKNGLTKGINLCIKETLETLKRSGTANWYENIDNINENRSVKKALVIRMSITNIGNKQKMKTLIKAFAIEPYTSREGVKDKYLILSKCGSIEVKFFDPCENCITDENHLIHLINSNELDLGLLSY